MHNLVLPVHAHGFDRRDEAFLCLGRKPTVSTSLTPTSCQTTTRLLEASLRAYAYWEERIALAHSSFQVVQPQPKQNPALLAER
jgi:hypothetical protein